jgi:hypothetical protein
MRTIAALVTVSLLGCSPKGAGITGGITFTAGLALYSAGSDSCDGQQVFCITDHEFGGFLMVVGSLILAGGLLTYAARGPTPDNTPLPNAPPAPFAVNEAPPGDDGQIYSGAPQPPPPPPIAEPQQARLPAAQLVYEDPQQRQFAFEASAAAGRGDCAAAIANGRQLWTELEHKLRAVDAAYARCAGN